MANQSQHFVRIGGFRTWILPSPGGFKWADTSEQCDNCGTDEYELADDNIVCTGCKAEYTIRNTDGTPATGFNACKPTQKENVMSKKPITKKVVKAKAKGMKVPRIGFGPFLRTELTKAPKTTLSVAKLASTMVKKFAHTKRDERHMRGWIYGIHRLLTKKGAAVSALDRGGDKPAKAGKVKKAKAGDIC